MEKGEYGEGRVGKPWIKESRKIMVKSRVRKGRKRVNKKEDRKKWHERRGE